MNDGEDTMMRRRTLLVAGLAGAGALLVGCASPARQQLRNATLPLKDGQIALNGWVKVAPDGSVTAVLGKSEMGQGVHTALLMLVAEELDCGWANMRAEYSPVDELYGNVAGLAEGVPFRPDDDGTLARSFRWVMVTVMRQMGFMMTGGSSSVKDLWQPMREAAAVTRATLVQAAAKSWGVPAAQLTVNEGTIAAPGGRTMTLGAAVKLLGANPEPATDVVLKSPQQFKLIGKPLRRLDAADKVSGRATFGIDVLRPGMVYAALRMSPVLGGRVATLDGAKASALPGVKKVLSLEPAHGGSGAVVVVADRWWRAQKALDAVTVQWDAGAAAAVSSAAAFDAMKKALDADEGFGFWKQGDVDEALKGAARKLEAEYSAPYLAHATLEPMNCTVEFKDGRATVWAPTQVPGFARRAAAQALDIDEEKVNVEVTFLGGGFGRRLEVDFVAQAAAIARQMPGTPVQLLWSRDEDTRHDYYRPACLSRFAAGLDAQGRIVAWRNATAGQAIVPDYLPRNSGLPGMGPDKTTSEGAFDTAYRFPAVRVTHARVELPLPVGFWRAVGHSHQAFFKESFVDECAHAAQADPLAYRLALLDQRPRERAVLELAAAKAGWGQPLAPAADGAKRARGIALHESFGSVVAQVAEVSVGPDRTIRVHRVVCAIDCGLPVNPNLIAQQMESSVVFGLSAALFGRIDIDQGRVAQGNFHDYRVLRIDESPLVETHVVPSTGHPEGVGEPGLPPIAPAVANAVFALTGPAAGPDRLKESP
jgi:isoquinoline 1-oxidoreductase subunit beta